MRGILKYNYCALMNRSRVFLSRKSEVVERALDAGYEPISMLVEHKHIETQAKELIARCGDIPVYTAEYDVLTKLTGFALTRGMLCAMKRRTLPTVEEVCSNTRRIAVLENVVNPTNVGAIFRSAAALHMDAVLLTPGCSNPLYRRAMRVSMGTVFQVPWTIFRKKKNGRKMAWQNYSSLDLRQRHGNCEMIPLISMIQV